MTQPNDPWATATAPQPTAQHSPRGGSGFDAGDYPKRNEGSGLLDVEDFETHPVLFTQEHAPGTTFKGTIVGAPRQVHSTCHPSKGGGERKKQYWERPHPDAPGELVLRPVNPETGEPNEPIYDQAITIHTGLIDPSIEDDDGIRTWFVSGSKRPKGHKNGEPTTSSRRAVIDAVRASGVIKTDDDWDGKTIEVTRVRREDPKSTTSKWLWVCKIYA